MRAGTPPYRGGGVRVFRGVPARGRDTVPMCSGRRRAHPADAGDQNGGNHVQDDPQRATVVGRAGREATAVSGRGVAGYLPGAVVRQELFASSDVASLVLGWFRCRPTYTPARHATVRARSSSRPPPTHPQVTHSRPHISCPPPPSTGSLGRARIGDLGLESDAAAPARITVAIRGSSILAAPPEQQRTSITRARPPGAPGCLSSRDRLR